MMYIFFYDFVYHQNYGYHKIGLRKSEMIINFMRNKFYFSKSIYYSLCEIYKINKYKKYEFKAVLTL